MATYATPDVYVEEISTFPPSVAEVETAVPAFIGYTEKADEFEPGDLLFEPTRISSLLDYQTFFGGAPPVDLEEVQLNENNAVASHKLKSQFYLYDSLRLFFKNGGGKCYIISIGTYSTSSSKQKSHFEDALKKLEKKDEPTLILFPDAVLLSGDDIYSIQQQALSQCSELMDRFAIFDLLEPFDQNGKRDWEQGKDDFRDKIGINDLKYGAAYTPWLKSNLGMQIRYRDLKGKVKRGTSDIKIEDLTSTQKVKDIVTDLDNALADVDAINASLTTLKSGEESLKTQYLKLRDTLRTTPNSNNLAALFTLIYDAVDQIDEWAAGASPLHGDTLSKATSLIATPLKGSMETVLAYEKGAETALSDNPSPQFSNYHPMQAAGWGAIFDENSPENPAADASIYTGANDDDMIKNAEPKISLVFDQVNAAITDILNTAKNAESSFETNLYESHVNYKTIVNKLKSSLTILPPSGAIAGVYAKVDNSRGVWKAPANVSLTNVVGVTETIDHKEQAELNVDVVAGKSINAIRFFTGKGILVWGARTLAGNDNEWRYVSVRRFFNMVEESVKKSTYWAVFEANDANTWIKVKSMIENYLVQKWRDGALAGAKPEQAFFVNVGLGVTMTAQDILEGRMNVEIGMAVVRPAEFIILKFSHKMQEA